MIDKKTEQQLMDYLFDEMTSEERKKFEKKLQGSEELREKLNDLKATQSILSGYSDDLAQNIPAPKPVLHQIKEDRSSKNSLTRYGWIAAAAVVLIGLFVGLFGAVQFGQTDQGYYLTFGNPPVQIEQDGISEEELNQIISQVRTENTLMLNSMVEQIQQEQNAQFNESLTALADYYEERRNRDLMLFTEGLLQLEESTANRIDRTNRALNGIIYALSTDQ